jgi:acyl-CoA synthetase (NDP forming)/GNAT superfamily N-acetyltransferase
VVTAAGVYALLADGVTIEIRPAAEGDFDAVKAMHAAMSPDNTYLRFFNLSRLSAEQEGRRVCRAPGPDHAALLALLSDQVVGVASYEVAAARQQSEQDQQSEQSAEIAFAVADHMHGRGVATLLLEHLVSLARSQRIRAFTAETLTENTAMLKVFADAGLPARRHSADGTVETTFPLPRDDADSTLDTYLDVVAERESGADVASLVYLLAPKSVAVIGASRHQGTVGRAILDNIRTGGYRGRVYAVNTRARHIGGVPCLPSVLDLPEPADVAVIAVPAAAVLGVAEECGSRGVRSLVVITSGLDSGAEADLLAVCRRHGMRLVGPNCFGIAIPDIALDATFAARHPQPGKAGLVVQSGGVGIALLEHLSRLGIGVSSFASVGDKLDVSGNDMLLWWEQDKTTKLAVLYLESFGNPRKFARTARHVGRKMPVLTVHAGRSSAGQRAAASHTAAAATPLVTREALFEQAGIIAADSFAELLDATALLASQPLPTGTRVAVVSNAGGAGVLAADACTDAGLRVAATGGLTRRELRRLLPSGAAVGGPVDTSTAVSAETFRRTIERIAADGSADAVLALVVPTATSDLIPAIQDANCGLPLAAVVLDQADTVRMLPSGKAGRSGGEAGLPLVPAYASPEGAARALAHAARYQAWRSRPAAHIPELSDLREDDARALIRAFLTGVPDGGWLPPGDVADLLGCYRIPLTVTVAVASEEAAVENAALVGGPVVLKADIPGLVHKTDAGAVQLDLRTEDDVRRAYRWLAGTFGERLRRVLLQPMLTGGTEVIVGVAQEPVFGPLVVFGLGGVATDVLDDHAARLAPLAVADADELIHSIRSAPLLLGYRGSPPADLDALRDVLLRVSRLADDLPEVAELDLNPVIARPDGAFAVDARIKIVPAEPQDPFLRRLR